MIEVMHDLPAGALGFVARGRVTSAEYRAIKMPCIEAAFAHHRKLRVLWLMREDFRSFAPSAAWQDLMFGLRHWRGWERIALVTDARWLRAFARAAGVLLPCDFRLFQVRELDSAKRWVSEAL